MNRWWALPLCLAIAVAAGWVLLSAAPRPGPAREVVRKAPSQHEEIDERSRDALREILRRADHEDRR